MTPLSLLARVEFDRLRAALGSAAACLDLDALELEWFALHVGHRAKGLRANTARLMGWYRV